MAEESGRFDDQAWRQRSAFSVFFDSVDGDADVPDLWRVRVYHEEGGEEVTLVGARAADWAGWVRNRLGESFPAHQASLAFTLGRANVRAWPHPDSRDNRDVHMELAISGLADLIALLEQHVVLSIFVRSKSAR